MADKEKPKKINGQVWRGTVVTMRPGGGWSYAEVELPESIVEAHTVSTRPPDSTILSVRERVTSWVWSELLPLRWHR